MSAVEPSEASSLVERLLDRLFGYDWFLSYRRSRAEGGAYARALDAELRSRGFRCFLDEREYPGGRVRASLRRAVRRSSTFVLVLTRGALDSEHCRAELAEAVRSGRVLAPILFPEGPEARDTGEPALAESHHYREAVGQPSTRPSAALLQELVQHFRHRRRASVQRRFLLAFSALLLGLLGASIALTLLVEARRREVLRSQARAMSLLLADRSARVRGETPLTSIALAADGVRRTLETERRALPAAESTLREALVDVGGRTLWSGGGLWNAAVSGAGGLMMLDQDRGWAAFDARTGSVRRGTMDRRASANLADSDGESFAFGDTTGRIEIYGVAAGSFAPSRRLVLEAGPVATCCDLDERAGRIAVGFADGRIEYWTLDSAPTRVARFDLNDAHVSVEDLPFELCRSSTPAAVLCGTINGLLVEIVFSGTGAAVSRDLSFGSPGVLGLALSPDARFVACGAADGSVALVPLDGTSELRQHRGHDGPVNALAWLGEDRLVSGGDDQAVLVWDLREPESETNPRRGLAHEQPVVHVGVHAGDVYSFDRGGTLLSWPTARADVAAEPRLFRELRGTIHAELIGPSEVLACVPGGELVRIDLEAGTTEELGPVGVDPPCFAASADGCVVAFATADGGVELAPARAPGTAETVPVPAGRTRSLALSRDGAVLVIGGESGSVHVWRRGQVELVPLEAHEEAVGAACVLPSGGLAVTGDWNGHVQLHDLVHATSRRLEPTPGLAPLEWVYGVAISSTGRFVAAGGAGAHVLVYQLTTSGGVVNVRALPIENTVYALCFARDEARLAATSPFVKEAWVFALEPARDAVPVRYPALEANLFGLAFDESNRTLVGWTPGGSIYRWRTEPEELLRLAAEHHPAALSPDDYERAGLRATLAGSGIGP